MIKDYRPVSLLPIYSKIFEKVIFNSLFKYLDDNNLLNSNQSGFQPGDSCVHQLLSIRHKICNTFYANPSLDVTGGVSGLIIILQHLQHFLMVTYWKLLVGLITSGRWYLTRMLQNRLKRLFSLSKQTQVTTELFTLTMYQWEGKIFKTI